MYCQEAYGALLPCLPRREKGIFIINYSRTSPDRSCTVDTSNRLALLKLSTVILKYLLNAQDARF